MDYVCDGYECVMADKDTEMPTNAREVTDGEIFAKGMDNI
jgi:hypothetical protein|tara:strand:+ start:2963 stop:3082 length:120 start_codon:yes stop_codon:yes gene_type:complete